METPSVPSVAKVAPRFPRLLLVEDHPSTRHFLNGILAVSYEVESFGDGEQAWQAAQRRAPDLVLCDVFLPGVDGIELTRLLRADAQTATVPIVLLTASHETALLLRGLEAGADDFLTKPFSLPELQARLSSHHQLLMFRWEAAARAGDERYRQIVESARDYAIFTFDAQHHVTSWNAGAEALTGFAPEDMIGRPMDLLYTAEDRERAVPATEISQAHQTGHFYNERWHMRKDGTQFWGSGILMPLREAGPEPGCLKILRDQTALHQAREEQKQLLQAAQVARQEAEEANATKDRFLASVSHELRTPLAPATLALHLLAQQKDLSDTTRQFLDMIRRSIDLEIRLIADLLDLGQITHGKFRMNPNPMDLHDAVQRALGVCQQDFAAKRLDVNVTLAADRHQIVGDAERLQQVFWNLLKNAAKFTPVGGQIAVRSSSIDSNVVVEITDTGIGIEGDALSKVFDAFEQGSAKHTHLYGGLGLGLAICRAIVTAHDGQITAESFGRDQGATFRVRLSTKVD